FIHAHAAEYHVDANRLGVFGGSAGGHLSLMLGLAPQAANPSADGVDRMPATVRAVAAWFPPTDFLNYGKDGNVQLGTGALSAFRAPFEFREIDPKTKCYVAITDPKRVKKIARDISPAWHVDA